MPLPLLGAVAAVGKGLVIGGAKAVAVGAKVGAKAAVSSGKFFAKGGANLARGGAKVARQGGKQVVKGAKFFKQKVSSVKEKGGNIASKLKQNASNIRESLKTGNKNQEKLRTKKQQRKQKEKSIRKKREKEKQLESKKSSSDQNKRLQSIAKSPLDILNKIFSLGGLLLGGILVNAFEGIKKKAEEFYNNNKELFDTIGNFLSGVKDAAVGLFDSFTGPYSEEGAFDDFAKFDENGKLQSGALKKVEDAYNGFGDLINSIDKALGGKGTAGNFIKTDTTSSTPMPSREELVNQTERGSGMASFREDAAENAALQESVRGQTSEGSSTGQASSGTTLNYGLVNPTPNTNILENKGGYAADTGLDIIGKVGDPIVSPVDGILEYAERGHTAQMGQDSDPTKPGIQDQLSFRIRLNKPFTFDGKKVNFVYGTHLATLDAGVANKFDIPIKAGQRLGTMGVANNVPHLHIGFVEDRAQTGFLNFKEVRRLLSGQSSNGEKKGAAGLLKGSRDERNKQMTTINQPDPTDEGGETIFIQRVNTIQYIPVPS